HHINRCISKLTKSLNILRQIPCQDTRMNSRVERLHTTTQHLRHSRHLLKRGHWQTHITQSLLTPPTRNQIPTMLHEDGRKFNQTRLVINTQQSESHQQPSFKSALNTKLAIIPPENQIQIKRFS